MVNKKFNKIGIFRIAVWFLSTLVIFSVFAVRPDVNYYALLSPISKSEKGSFQASECNLHNAKSYSDGWNCSGTFTSYSDGRTRLVKYTIVAGDKGTDIVNHKNLEDPSINPINSGIFPIENIYKIPLTNFVSESYSSLVFSTYFCLLLSVIGGAVIAFSFKKNDSMP